ncbi:ABC transporter substrate-binding protein [Bauldia sp.]|uniref:ABC transporter substrate-binding protein n=1 Tax=Bauldia sp. TaxID=2575872 RepID=UPI003BA85B61
MGLRTGSATLALAVAAWIAVPSALAAKTLVYCAPGSPEGFDPAPFSLDTTLDVSAALYDGLVRFKPGTATVEPALASEWEVSDNGLEYTFRLRPDVAFHDTETFTPTRPLNADDVIFSFERQWRPDHPYYDYGGGTWPYFSGLSMPEVLRDIRRQDDATVVFVLNRPQSAFLSNLALGFASILSKEYADVLFELDERQRLSEAPVGTGPFRYVDHEEGIATRLAANPDYWNGAPPLDSLVFATTPDSDVRVARLLADNCHVAAAPSSADLESLPVDADATVVQSPGAMVTYLAYNTTQPPFDRAEVRRALNRAVDKQAIVEAVFGGQAIPADTPIPPGLVPDSADLSVPGYDPDAARTALADAGAGNVSLRLLPLHAARPFNPDPIRTAEMIQADLEAIGVDVTVVETDLSGFVEQSIDPENDSAVLFGWTAANGDPDGFLAAPLGCDARGISNRAEWCSPRFEALLRRGQALPPGPDRDAVYAEALTIFVDEAPWLPIAHATVTAAVSDRVRGFVVDPMGRYRFQSVDLAEE